MKDRVATNPNRYKIEFEGELGTQYGILSLDDSPIEEGTVLNAQNLLGSSAIESLGLNPSAVPTDAFKQLHQNTVDLKDATDNSITDILKTIAEITGGFKLLWSGSERMGATKSIPVDISGQLLGVFLVWQLASSNTAAPYGDKSVQFIPKGVDGTFIHRYGTVIFSLNCAKRVEVSGNTISGTEYNGQTGTASNILYDNRRMVLTEIYGF